MFWSFGETSFVSESSMPTIGDVMEAGGVGCRWLCLWS
jgi:hypothetical protein